MMDKATHVASSSQYLPTQVDSYIGHYMDRILHTGHM